MIMETIRFRVAWVSKQIAICPKCGQDMTDCNMAYGKEYACNNCGHYCELEEHEKWKNKETNDVVR